MPHLPQLSGAESFVNQSATFIVFAGIAGSGKTSSLMGLYRDALRHARRTAKPGTALWLSPTNRARAELRSRLLDDSLEVVLRPNLFTFDEFADEVLKAAPQAIAPCSGAMQRILLRRVISELSAQKQLRHFRSIALTSGFLDLVTAFISELKRAETWPEHFAEACIRRGNRTGDRELGLIYDRYQQSLVSANVYDGEGRFWSARTALEDGHWGRFANLSLAVVDGFTDFTGAQYKILELLARRAGCLHVSLLAETPLVRSDLFAKTATVISRFEKSGTVEVRAFPLESRLQADGGIDSGLPAEAGTPAIPPAIRHIAANLFVNPRDVPRSPDATGVEVVEVAGVNGEVRWLAARVKQLLLEGMPPDDIVVAIRDLDGYADLIEEVFSAAGIPFAGEAGLPGSRLAPVKALANLLSLEIEDWPYGRLMAFLDSGFFQPEWEEFENRRAVRDVAAELRRHQLAEGREQILAALERIANHQVSDEVPPTAVPAYRAWRLLSRLAQATTGLRRGHDFSGWSGVIASLVRELGFDRAPLDSGADEPDRTLGSYLTAILYDAARGEQVAGPASAQLTLAEFLGELTDLLGHQRLPPRRREEGRVRVLSAEQIRNLDVPYLFLAGLSETSFPRHRSDDCLYGEGDRRELNDCGLSLGHRTLRGQEELLMFYGIVTRARRQLVLTYPVVGEDGQPLSSSPYVSSIRELFIADALTVHLEEQLDPVPKPERVLAPADVRVRAMADALEGRPELFRAVCESQQAARHCLAAIDMNVRRFQTPGFTNYEGVLENPRNIELFNSRFSPAAHEFSATQLEAYAACPFRFLMGHVLKLDPPAPPDVETDYARRGSHVHELLAEVHRNLSAGRDESGKPRPIPTGAEVAREFQRLLEAKMKQRPAPGRVHQALDRIEQRLLAEWGVAYGLQWDEFVQTLPGDVAQPPLPALFEAAFGAAKEAIETEATNSTELSSADVAADGTRDVPATVAFPPLILGEGDSAVRIGGRIDRIDVGFFDGQPVFTAIDYKTGRGTKVRFDTLETGRKVQLALYVLAVARLGIAGSQARPWQMGYWYIRETGFLPDVKTPGQKSGEPLEPISEADWSELVKTLEQVVLDKVAGIRAGRFPVENSDPDCTSRCPYNTICRVAQIRSLPDSQEKFSKQ